MPADLTDVKAVDLNKEIWKRYKQENPWSIIWSRVNQRCTNPRNISFKRYGALGIKNFLSVDDIKFLWVRDNAPGMKQPSIDRIRARESYSIDNCRFIEKSLNTARSNGEKTHCKYGHEFTPQNTKIDSRNPKHRSCKTCAIMWRKKYRGKIPSDSWPPSSKTQLIF